MAKDMENEFTFQYGEIKRSGEQIPGAALQEFTFQYGEIKSAGGIADELKTHLFTFQYGEIKSTFTLFVSRP